jgi:hypothetical protein
VPDQRPWIAEEKSEQRPSASSAPSSSLSSSCSPSAPLHPMDISASTQDGGRISLENIKQTRLQSLHLMSQAIDLTAGTKYEPLVNNTCDTAEALDKIAEKFLESHNPVTIDLATANACACLADTLAEVETAKYMAHGVATGLQHQAEHPLASVGDIAKAPARIAKIFLPLAAIYSPPADPSLAAQQLQRAQQATQMINAKIAEKIDRLRRMSWQEYTQHSAQILTETFVDIIKFRTLGLAANQIAKVEKYLSKIAKLIEAERPVAAAVGSTPTITTLLEEAAPALKIAAEKGQEFTQALLTFATEDAEFAQSEIFGKSFSEKLSNFFERWSEKRKQKIFQTGAREVTYEEYMAGEAWAANRYEEIRQCTTDIQEIAKSTGLPEHKIARIKKHLFFDEHILDLSKPYDRGRIARIDPSKPIAEAWARLQNGSFSANDIKLLEHEYFESKFEQLFKEANRVAHEKTISSGRDWKPE